MANKNNINTLTGRGESDFYNLLPDTAAKSKTHACKMGSFKAVDMSKLGSLQSEKLKGITTVSRHIQETDRLEKNKIQQSDELKYIKKLQLTHLRYQNRRFQQISSFKELSSLPEDGELIKLVTQQQINAYTLILMIHQQHGIHSAYVTTYNFSSVAIQSLLNLLSDGCDRLTLVCNESMRLMMPKRFKS
ncbi:MAG: hypothetical protein JXR39_11495 [Marinilabiliaceae bacterium]|nr:hypothetical protein [Marinilabiliaceae bacterium]